MFRFGVLGVSGFALRKMIPAMRLARGVELVAIASRDGGKAAETARTLGLARSYGSYEALIADPEIDAVYNPLPNHLHVPWSERAADAGKHVLCEKPIALGVAEGRRRLARHRLLSADHEPLLLRDRADRCAGAIGARCQHRRRSPDQRGPAVSGWPGDLLLRDDAGPDAAGVVAGDRRASRPADGLDPAPRPPVRADHRDQRLAGRAGTRAPDLRANQPVHAPGGALRRLGQPRRPLTGSARRFDSQPGGARRAGAIGEERPVGNARAS